MRRWHLLLRRKSGLTYLVEYVVLQQMRLSRCHVANSDLNMISFQYTCCNFFSIWSPPHLLSSHEVEFQISYQALGDIKSINLFGVQQICRNSIALEQVCFSLVTHFISFVIPSENQHLHIKH